MLKVLLTVFTCAFTYTQNNFKCISLGEVCSTSAALQAFNLRNAAYPFDWTISPLSGVSLALFEDFQEYLNPKYFKIRGDKHGVINKYGITFVHDFPTINYTGNNIEQEDLINENILLSSWLGSLPQIQDKYFRRIRRFLEDCNSKDKIFFFRHFSATKNAAIKLRDLIEIKYPNLQFTLVIVGNKPDEYIKPWHERKIKNYYLNDTLVWNDVKEWNKIFTDLGLIQKTKSFNLNLIDYTKHLCGHCYYCKKNISETETILFKING